MHQFLSISWSQRGCSVHYTLYTVHIVCAIPKTRYAAYFLTQQRIDMDTGYSTQYRYFRIEWMNIHHAPCNISPSKSLWYAFGPYAFPHYLIFGSTKTFCAWSVYDVRCVCVLPKRRVVLLTSAFCLYALTADSPRPTSHAIVLYGWC